MPRRYDPAAVGRRLREERRRTGLSQVEVARRAGLSESFVRLVEAGRSDISLSRLLPWVSLFDLPVGALLEEDPRAAVTVVRGDGRAEIPCREAGIRFFLLATGGRAELEPAIFALAPGASMQQPLVHQGEESVFVIAGTVQVRVGDEELTLAAGDSAYYSSELPHRFANPHAREPSEVLVTTTHPALHSRAFASGTISG